MKKINKKAVGIIVLLLALLLLSGGCRAKKLSSSNYEAKGSSYVNMNNNDSSKAVDTTKSTKNKTTITEVEFYPNDGMQLHTKIDANGHQNMINSNPKAIKSIKQTIIESEKTENGKSKESSLTASKKEAIVQEKKEARSNKQVDPVHVSKFKYIFYILILSSIILIYLKRIPIISKIRTILKGLMRIF